MDNESIFKNLIMIQQNQLKVQYSVYWDSLYETFQLVKYLRKLLSSLAQSNYTINSTKNLMMKIKNEKFKKIVECCNLIYISFYFGSIRTHHIIKANLWKTWKNNSMVLGKFPPTLNSTLTLTRWSFSSGAIVLIPNSIYKTWNVHFSFNKDIYICIDEVAMGSHYWTQ